MQFVKTMWFETHTTQSLRNNWVKMCYMANCYSRSLHNQEMSNYEFLARYLKLRIAQRIRRECRERFPRPAS